MEVYLVGGAVRDRFLGLPIKEKDWCVVGSSPEEMKRLGFQSVGKDFPVFLHPETKEEYSLARTEKKIGPGYHGFDFSTSRDITLQEDLKRRDLTINAMAIDSNENLIDPFNGLIDLENKKLKHVSKSYQEDPVRVLRTAKFAARFYQLGFSVHTDTKKVMKKISVDGELDYLVEERVWKEMKQALSDKDPHIFFSVLQECGALEKLLPEFYDKNSSIKHNFNIIKDFANRSFDPAVNLSILIFDVQQSIESTQKKVRISYKKILESLNQRLPIPKKFIDTSNIFIEIRRFLDFVYPFDEDEILALLENTDAFRRTERFERGLEVCSIMDPSEMELDYYKVLRNIIDRCNNKSMREIIDGETNPNKIREKISGERKKVISQEINKKFQVPE